MESPHKGKTGFKRVWNALFYSFDGLSAAFRHEDAFRQELVLACIMIPAALYLPVAAAGKCLMIASVIGVPLVMFCSAAIFAVATALGAKSQVRRPAPL